MFYVMVEISNYPQLLKLKPDEMLEVRAALDGYCRQQGGRFCREQNGYFLFLFHPLREQVLQLIGQFLELTTELLRSLDEELFGFNGFFEESESEELLVFNQLQGQIFLSPHGQAIWAGPNVAPRLGDVFDLYPQSEWTEIGGLRSAQGATPLNFNQFLRLSGWFQALEGLCAQVEVSGQWAHLQGQALLDKALVLDGFFRQCPDRRRQVTFTPRLGTKDFVAQLLHSVDAQQLSEAIMALNPEQQQLWAGQPQWESLLRSRGAEDYPGDSCESDVLSALRLFLTGFLAQARSGGYRPYVVVIAPQHFEIPAQQILRTLLEEFFPKTELVVLVVDDQRPGPQLLTDQSALAWEFPALNLAGIRQEAELQQWQDKIVDLTQAHLDQCQNQATILAHWLWGRQTGLLEKDALASEDASWRLLLGLDMSHRRVYYVALLALNLGQEQQLLNFFCSLGDDASVIQDKIDNLRRLGFISFLPDLVCLRPDFQSGLASHLGQAGVELKRRLAEYLFALWKSEKRHSEWLFGFLQENGLFAWSVPVLEHYCQQTLDRGQEVCLKLLRPALWEKAPTEELREVVKQLAAAFQLRFALRNGTNSLKGNILDTLTKAFTSRTEPVACGEWLLQKGRYYLSQDELKTGFQLVKKSLILAQERRAISLEIRANLEVGLALLRFQKLDEGREYFEIAGRQAEKQNALFILVQANILDALSQFLLGSLTGATKLLERWSLLIARSGMQQWKVFAALIRTRLEFDRGHYDQALQWAESGRLAAIDHQFAAAESVFRLWAARAEAYSGDTRKARSRLQTAQPSAERNYFLAECYFFDRDPVQAIELMREGIALVKACQPFGSESVIWTSGFASIEDRLLSQSSQKGVLEGQAEAFLVFLEGVTQVKSNASSRFQDIVAQKNLLELDISTAQYYYWYYLTLPKNDLQFEAQRLTLLGRSLKAIQIRASRIENPVERQDFMQRPYWNTQIMNEAKKVKLL